MSLLRIRALPQIVKKNGFEYRLVKRNDKKAIYSQHNGLGDICAFEVFKYRLSNPHPKAEEDLKNFDKVEVFPLDEEFGARAWTYKDREDAERAFLTK